MRTTRIVVLGIAVVVCIAASAMPALAQGAKAKPAASGETPKAAPADAKPAEAAVAAVPAPSASGSGVQYRIGVVNRKQVLDKYKKVKDEYKKLQAKVDAEQGDIDKLSKKIEDMKKEYDDQKGSMTPEQKATKEADVQKEYGEYKSLLDKKQREIDADEQLLMRTVLSEIDQVVSKIATEQGYHLVLEGGGRSVVFYSPTIDITQRVVDALNSKQ